MDILPDELWMRIAEYCTGIGLMKWAITCTRAWSILSNDYLLWKRVCEREFGYFELHGKDILCSGGNMVLFDVPTRTEKNIGTYRELYGWYCMQPNVYVEFSEKESVQWESSVLLDYLFNPGHFDPVLLDYHELHETSLKLYQHNRDYSTGFPVTPGFSNRLIAKKIVEDGGIPGQILMIIDAPLEKGTWVSLSDLLCEFEINSIERLHILLSIAEALCNFTQSSLKQLGGIPYFELGLDCIWYNKVNHKVMLTRCGYPMSCGCPPGSICSCMLTPYFDTMVHHAVIKLLEEPKTLFESTKIFTEGEISFSFGRLMLYFLTDKYPCYQLHTMVLIKKLLDCSLEEYIHEEYLVKLDELIPIPELRQLYFDCVGENLLSLKDIIIVLQQSAEHEWWNKTQK